MIKITSEANYLEAEDHSQVIRSSLRNPSGSNTGNFSLSDDIDVLSSSSARSHTVSWWIQMIVVRFHEPHQFTQNKIYPNVNSIMHSSQVPLAAAGAIEAVEAVSEKACFTHENYSVVADYSPRGAS